MTKLNGSVKIKEFLDYLAEAEKQHTYACGKMIEEDKRIQDLLHQLELKETKYADRQHRNTLNVKQKSAAYEIDGGDGLLNQF